MKRLIDVYPYSYVSNEVKFLILKRTHNVIYGGQWRMVGGKVQQDETAFEAGVRELCEETNLKPTLFWVLPSINQFYDMKSDAVKQIPAFGAEVDKNANIVLNHEHEDWKWISQDKIDTYIQWPEQKRLMNLLADIVTSNQILEEWIIAS
ncbi:NUDIX domain-containing protein [Fodinibius sp. Rm-B-1B1-1]|uniref:NUDIX domain-containing protein n=1 Tax=Fodinibius alkaliphilus TaxID=3140241 RepID=UPI00315B1CB4